MISGIELAEKIRKHQFKTEKLPQTELLQTSGRLCSTPALE
jgi:hypothetical protein